MNIHEFVQCRIEMGVVWRKEGYQKAIVQEYELGSFAVVFVWHCAF